MAVSCEYCGVACWMAKAAAGVIRSSQSAAPTGRMEAAPRMYGSTIATMTRLTAAALRRSIVPRATARTAATAISAAVPTTMRSSVGHGTGYTYEPRACASWAPKITAAAAAASPATKLTAPITMAFAASIRPRRGLAASVTRIRPRRYSAVMNIVATTITTISPANVPMRCCVTVVPASPACPGTTGAISPEPVTVNRPAAVVTPADPRTVGGARILAGPRAGRPAAGPAEVIEDGGVLAGADQPVFPAAEALGDRLVRGGRGEQPGLDGRRQPGQVNGAHHGPVRAVGRVVAGDRVAGAGQPQPARGCRGNGAWLARGVAGVVVLHAYPVV